MTFSTWEANTAHLYKLISIKTKNTTSQEKMKIEKNTLHYQNNTMRNPPENSFINLISA